MAPRVESLRELEELIMRPQTKYAKSGNINIAYQVVGTGPFDPVYVMGWVSTWTTSRQNLPSPDSLIA